MLTSTVGSLFWELSYCPSEKKIKITSFAREGLGHYLCTAATYTTPQRTRALRHNVCCESAHGATHLFSLFCSYNTDWAGGRAGGRAGGELTLLPFANHIQQEGRKHITGIYVCTCCGFSFCPHIFNSISQHSQPILPRDRQGQASIARCQCLLYVVKFVHASDGQSIPASFRHFRECKFLIVMICMICTICMIYSS